MGWVGLGWCTTCCGLGWVCTLVGWVRFGFKKLTHVHVWSGTVGRPISDYVGCHTASSGDYWRHFYSDSEATAQCELFLTAPNRHSYLLTFKRLSACFTGGNRFPLRAYTGYGQSLHGCATGLCWAILVVRATEDSCGRWVSTAEVS